MNLVRYGTLYAMEKHGEEADDLSCVGVGSARDKSSTDQASEPRYATSSVSHAIPPAAGHVVQYVQYLNKYTIEVTVSHRGPS